MPLAKKTAKKYTYRDYLSWDDGSRLELIDGAVYDMTPAPSREHQELSMTLSLMIGNALKGHRCKIYAAPFDVRLPDKGEADGNIVTVVQPDIVVVCDPKKLDDRGCRGAPDLVIEITSPATASKDMKEKLALYEKHGVKEYWIVHPGDKTIMIFRIGKNREYGRPSVFVPGDTAKSAVVKTIAINVDEVFGVR